jgi:hypothetical protein
MKKQITIVVKDNSIIAKPGCRGRDIPYLFDTKKDAHAFEKRCKSLKLEYVIK